MNHDLGARSVRDPNFKPSPTTITTMNTARIADLLAPFLREQLSDLQLTQISTYIDLLLRWNARTNLTAIRDPESIATRHFGESLFAAQTLFPAPAPAPKNTASTHPVADSIQADASVPTRTDAGTFERVDAGAPA